MSPQHSAAHLSCFLTAPSLRVIFAAEFLRVNPFMTNILHIASTFAERLRAARASAGWSQVTAAKRLRVSIRTYQAWEAGDAFPQIRHRKRISDFLERHEEAA